MCNKPVYGVPPWLWLQFLPVASCRDIMTDCKLKQTLSMLLLVLVSPVMMESKPGQPLVWTCSQLSPSSSVFGLCSNVTSLERTPWSCVSRHSVQSWFLVPIVLFLVTFFSHETHLFYVHICNTCLLSELSPRRTETCFVLLTGNSTWWRNKMQMGNLQQNFRTRQSLNIRLIQMLLHR